MSPCPRHHDQGRWAREHGEDIRAAARTLARLFGAESRDGWRDAGWHRQQQKWPRRSGPRGFGSLPPMRSFQGTPGHDNGIPVFAEKRDGEAIGQDNPQAKAPKTEGPA